MPLVFLSTKESCISAYERTDSSFISLILEKAKEIMRQPQSRINEVARDVGYSYSSYFTKVFSQKEGITPSEWKKNNT